MATPSPRPRARTRFERSLFLGIVLVALTLGAVSIASLFATGQGLRSLFERLWTETGTEAVKRDLAFFARHYLDDLALANAGALRAAAAQCGPAAGSTALDCILDRLVDQEAIPASVTVRALRLYRRDAGAWRLIAERERAETDAGPGSHDSGEARADEPKVPAAALERFLATAAQPVQRRIGFVESFATWAGAPGEADAPRVLVVSASTDSGVTARWRRSVAHVEQVPFAPFISQLVRRQSAWLLAGMAVVTILAVYVSRLLSARVSRPLAELVAAMGEVSRGNLSYRAPQMAQEEFGFLAGSFNSMTENIERLNREAREAARIRRELEMAREIQLMLFPQELPRLEGFDLFAANVPSLEVSGDYYDVLPWGSAGPLALVLADVSGKGIPAALLMSNIQACLRSQAMRPREDPCEWMAAMNRQLLDSTESKRFVTFFLGVLEPSMRDLVYINGGHNPPLLMRAGGAVEELSEGGPLLGAIPDARYQKARVALAPGDVLVLYTDGVTEACSPAGEMFGEERLRDLVRDARNLSAGAIGQRIFDEVSRHSSLDHQADDMTVIVLRRGQAPMA